MSENAQNTGVDFFKDVLALPSQSGLIYNHFENHPQHLEHLGIDSLLQTFHKKTYLCTH